ncbi:MAG: hypothetical protein NC311_00950 [Muribaculaceae bacterium]|nr:hypothetical protein [Muribaculaceae bacterium]
MLTKIDLCSMALLKIGEEPIQSWMDDTATAKLCRTLFDTVTDALLAAHPWRFAARQYDLTRNTDGDCLIPPDVLRILRCPGEIIGNRIICNTEKISIMAITRVAPDAFPSFFVSLSVAKLAMELCIPLTGDQTVFRMLASLYESELQSARFIDSTTSQCREIENFSLINARF